jgi:hypothetical protein
METMFNVVIQAAKKNSSAVVAGDDLPLASISLGAICDQGSKSVSENFCTPRGTKILARTSNIILGSIIWTSARQRASCTSMATVDII